MSAKKHVNATVAVVDRYGRPLMPTNSYRARRLLKSGRAGTYCYRPIFTIMMLDADGGDVQPMELKMDTGYQHIGISVCSEKHEFVSRQYDLLADEPERHNDARKYRRTRRNRLRYRKKRFGNRKGMICKEGFAPSIRNKHDRHVDIAKAMCGIFPITDIYIEMGQFDTQVLKAIAEGRPIPEGEDYQHGEAYGFRTLREAVFTRDGYSCVVCGRSAYKDKAILHEHHIGFWKDIPDRTNRMSNLATVCEKCHTPPNHKPGGKLYGMNPRTNGFKGATFMTTVRFSMYRLMQGACPDAVLHMTYGAATKLAREYLKLPKSHANDAYCMGKLHPKRRAHFEHFKKRRRNNRILEKFYDAVYIDIRDGSKKKGSQLSCNRTKRSMPRQNPQNERMYRGEKISKGRRSIRTTRHIIQAGDLVCAKGIRCICHGTMSGGKSILLLNAKESPTGKAVTAIPKAVTVLKHTGGWVPVSQG